MDSSTDPIDRWPWVSHGGKQTRTGTIISAYKVHFLTDLSNFIDSLLDQGQEIMLNMDRNKEDID
eukprot:3479431-Ditylum_brightwellii.AAC.1